VCEQDDETLNKCVQALTHYNVIQARSVSECLQLKNVKPDLLLSAHILNDGTCEQIAHAFSDAALKVVIMTSNDDKIDFTAAHQVILKPFNTDNLNRLCARIINKCVICLGLGRNYRVWPCGFCDGTGLYYESGFAFLSKHRCDCPFSARCEVCRRACHCLN
jgi:hypothetical protein